MVSSRMFLLPAIYHTRCRFSNLGGFMKRVGAEFDSISFSKKSTLKILEDLIIKFESEGKESSIGQQAAEKLVIARDLRDIQKQAAGLEEFDPVTLMLKDFDKLVEESAKIGFSVDGVQIFLVDEFPEPFNKMDWTFFNADKDDEKKYGIPFGIYVKKTAAIPIYTTFLICHELIHVAIGLKETNKIARGLEEGLAELLGCILLFSRLKGCHLAANLLIYNRLYYPPNQFWDVYLDNLKQAILLYHQFGLAGLKELVHEGRDRIKDVEKLLLKGDYIRLGLAKGEWDEDVNYLTSHILAFPRNYVVSPLANYISNFVKTGMSIKEITSVNNIDPIEGEEGIRELNQKLFLVVINNGIITNCDIDTLSNTTVLRYLL